MKKQCQCLEEATHASPSHQHAHFAHNVLVTTDFSKISKTALPYAAALAGQYGAKILVAHALSPEPRLGVPVERLPVEADLAWLEAEGKLAKFALGNSLGVRPAKMLLERGDVWDVISDIIQKNKIDLVVTATHGRQGLKKLVMGSAAEKIYRRATCPVLTIGPQVPALERPELESSRPSCFPPTVPKLP